MAAEPKRKEKKRIVMAIQYFLIDNKKIVESYKKYIYDNNYWKTKRRTSGEK
jgi:hypothetical protein